MSDDPNGAPLPLSHIKVIDLCRARAGPTAVRQLGDLGAQIIKVEEPGGDDGDIGSRHSFDFQNLHPNKRSLTLNLKQESARQVLLRLVETADVLVENYRPDVKHRLKIDYETLSQINPRLIYGSISGFGQTGPYRHRPGLDQIAQGLSGLMSVTGLPGQGYVRAGIPIADLSAGVMLSYGILAALVERERSGKGQWVHTSLLQAMVRMMDLQAVRWLIGGEVPPQAGNYHPVGVPTGVYRVKDGAINIQAAGNRLYARLCKAIGGEELITDPRFEKPEARRAHREEMTDELEKRLAARSMDEWVAILNEAGVPSGPLLNVKEAFENEQIRHLEMVKPTEHPAIGTVNLLGFGVNLDRTPPRMRSAAPEQGEHTQEILGELGYSQSEIDQLARDGAI
ncbi:MAG TPA: CoA transferase [Dehalococcoidia bacterium]|nr:CoA transferase [Dehalococcoidia bacterium]